MSDLGTDFDGSGGDLQADMRELNTPDQQLIAWAQNQAERLLTPRGALWYDTDYGLDMREYIADDEDPAVAAHEINSELKKDERTARASTNISVSASGDWTVATTIVAVTGQSYELTFTVTGAQTTLLSAAPSSP